jgi:hypothetical protein
MHASHEFTVWICDNPAHPGFAPLAVEARAVLLCPGMYFLSSCAKLCEDHVDRRQNSHSAMCLLLEQFGCLLDSTQVL